MLLEKHIRELLTTKGFVDTFFGFCGEYDKTWEAYEATERKYRRYFGVKKYANYESFKTVKNRYLKNKIKNK